MNYRAIMARDGKGLSDAGVLPSLRILLAPDSCAACWLDEDVNEPCSECPS